MQRHHHGGTAAHRIRATGLALLCGHLLSVAWLTLRPLSVPWVSPANLRPFASIQADLASGPQAALEGIGGGLLLLAPLGILLPMVAGGRASRLGSWFRTVFAGAMISLCIELVQPVVPGRVADVDALLLNTTGVALVHLLLFPALRTRLRRAGRHADGRAEGHTERHAERHAEGRAGRGERSGARSVGGRGQGAAPAAPRVGMAP